MRLNKAEPIEDEMMEDVSGGRDPAQPSLEEKVKKTEYDYAWKMFQEIYCGLHPGKKLGKGHSFRDWARQGYQPAAYDFLISKVQ